jgi:nitric oxide reductase large subunit
VGGQSNGDYSRRIEGDKMISWKLREEKEIVLYYAKLLNDDETIKIMDRNQILNKQEALHVAEFFWAMVEKSNEVQYNNDVANCEFLLEKVINTLMAYFRDAGYESEWQTFADL